MLLFIHSVMHPFMRVSARALIYLFVHQKLLCVVSKSLCPLTPFQAE